MIHVLESDDYRKTREALMADPIIRVMAQELPADWRLRFTYGGTADRPNYNFMAAALETYKERGGTINTHIGGPAEAIIALRKQPPPPEAAGYDRCGGCSNRYCDDCGWGID